MEIGRLTTIYDAEASKFDSVSDRVDRKLKQTAQTAEKATRDVGGALGGLGDVVLRTETKIDRLRDAKGRYVKLSDQATTSAGGLGRELAGLDTRAGLLNSGMGLLSTTTLGAAGGITAVAAAGISLISVLSSLVSSAVATGSELNDLSIKSGLSVEMLSGLKLQATQSGTSIDALAAGVFILQKNVEGGSKGVLKLAADMGITQDNVADADGTLRRLLEGLAKIPDEATRNAAGAKLMGRGYQDLAVFVKDLNGDVDLALEKTREMGGLWSGKAAADADRLGDEIDALSARASALGVNIGSSVIPSILHALDEANAGYEGHGSVVAFVVSGVVGYLEQEIDRVASLAAQINNISRLGAMSANFGLAGGLLSIYGTEQERQRRKAESQVLGDVANLENMARRFHAASQRRSGGSGGGGARRGGGGGGKQKSDEQELAEEIQKLERQYALLGDTSRRSSLETEILTGKFRSATEATKARALATANLYDVTQSANAGWKQFTTYARGVSDELRGGLTPLEEYERKIDELMEAIVGTDGFIDGHKEAEIEVGRLSARFLTLNAVLEDVRQKYGDVIDRTSNFTLPPPSGYDPNGPISVMLADDFQVDGSDDPHPSGLIKWLDDIEKAREKFQSVASDVESIFSNTFLNIGRDFKGTAANMAMDFAMTVARMAADAAAAQLTKALLGDSSTGWLAKLLGMGASAIGGGFTTGAPTGSSSANALSPLNRFGFNMFGGGRSGGGDVQPGYFYEVNEHGKEFIAPTSPLRVLNQNQVSHFNQGETVTKNTYNINLQPVRNVPDSYTQRKSMRTQADMLLGVLQRVR